MSPANQRLAGPSGGPLAPAPATFVDPSSGLAAFGAYAGPLPPVDLGRLGLHDRVARRKRWFYGAIVTREVWISYVVLRTGYAATAFAFVWDVAGRRMLVDRTVLAPSLVSRVADDVHQQGEIAHFALGRSRIAVHRGAGGLDLEIRLGDLEVAARIDEAEGPPAITAIAPVGPGLVNATEKRALLPVTRGHLRLGAREADLANGRAGYDYTNGLLPRHTRWRWAFAQGRTTTGEEIGFNLVEGFVGQAECAAFTAGRVTPLAEPVFTFDVRDPLQPWTVRGEGIDLTFTPGGVHRQHTNLLVVRSRFIQPVGTFRGTVRVDGRDLVVDGLPGVVEDQDVVW
ncbi:MAG: hypothetical protein JWP97_4719 [Labilithrix sp.]|nr:hypothetical protein [Labilithrix sp.]